MINTNDELVYISRSPVPVSKSKIKIKYFKQYAFMDFQKTLNFLALEKNSNRENRRYKFYDL